MLSVICPKCSARYSMSEELYRRTGGGEAVVVTCRKCRSEIRFEAANEKTKPSNETPMPHQPAKATSSEDMADEDHGPFVALSSGFFGASPKPAQPAATPEPEMAEAAKAAVPVEEPAPESEMPVDSSELFSDDQVMSVRGDDLVESETVPLVMNKAGNGAAAAAFEPSTNPKLKKPLPPPRKREAEKTEAVEDDEQGPPSSSGTPTLTTLMGESRGSVRPKTRDNADFFAGFGGNQSISMAPPTIDVASLAPPESEAIRAMDSSAPSSIEPGPDSIPVLSRTPHKKKKKKKHGQATSHAPPSLKPSIASTAKPVTTSAPAQAKAQSQAEPQKSSGLLWLVGLLVLGAVGFFVYHSQSKPVEPETAQAAEPTAPLTAAPTAPVAEAPTTTSVAEAPSAAAPTPTAAPIKPAEGAVNKPAEGAVNKPAELAVNTPPTEAKPAPNEGKPAEAKPAPNEGKPAEAAASGGSPFQSAAAKAALAASAAQASGCRKGDDPSGSAVVIVTFAPSGRVTSANVNGPPFAGTATGGCIATVMRKTNVPPFDGDRITVSKTVQIQ